MPIEGDWAPQLLDGMLSSPNSEARESLQQAAFAAGAAIIPQLEAALKDDRTAEFAAQALAMIGGEQALRILAKLVRDPRELGLQRFYYGALGEYSSAEAGQVLLNTITRSDDEPDRTVTEAAILALTVRSDPDLVLRLRQAKTTIKDVVIRDDLENALDVIEVRARYLASPKGKRAGGSVNDAVRTYFIPALEPAAGPAALKPAPAGGPASPSQQKTSASGRRAASSRSPAGAERADPPDLGTKVSIRNLTLSPDRTRALAQVVFEDPSALANYDIVLQKEYGNWRVASVWLGSESEKPAPSGAQEGRPGP